MKTKNRNEVAGMHREQTRVVHIGDRKIGNGNPVLIQYMTNTKTEDIQATVNQILKLEAVGCEIVRCTVPDEEAARALKEIMCNKSAER